MTPTDEDLHRVKFTHEVIHERLVNWGRWCRGGRGSSSTSPMFRGYKAPRYRSAVDDDLRIPVDGLDAVAIEKCVATMPERHRDAVRWFYVYSHLGMGIWQAVRGLAISRDALTKLVHDGRSMVKNRLDTSQTRGTIAPQFDPAPAVPASRREAQATAERPKAGSKELHPV